MKIVIDLQLDDIPQVVQLLEEFEEAKDELESSESNYRDCLKSFEEYEVKK